jgi:hypothetical protein
MTLMDGTPSQLSCLHDQDAPELADFGHISILGRREMSLTGLSLAVTLKRYNPKAPKSKLGNHMATAGGHSPDSPQIHPAEIKT